MTEDKPHIVYPRALIEGYVRHFRNYADAYSFWKSVSSYNEPYLIATVGRVIDPSTPIIDVNE